MITYFINLLEACSQVLNTIHGGDPNQTFSARVAGYRDDPKASWYWSAWIIAFNVVWPGHLDWASQED